MSINPVATVSFHQVALFWAWPSTTADWRPVEVRTPIHFLHSCILHPLWCDEEPICWKHWGLGSLQWGDVERDLEEFDDTELVNFLKEKQDPTSWTQLRPLTASSPTTQTSGSHTERTDTWIHPGPAPGQVGWRRQSAATASSESLYCWREQPWLGHQCEWGHPWVLKMETKKSLTWTFRLASKWYSPPIWWKFVCWIRCHDPNIPRLSFLSPLAVVDQWYPHCIISSPLCYLCQCSGLIFFPSWMINPLATCLHSAINK